MKMIDKILKASNDLGLKQTELEVACGFSENRLSKWKKSGKYTPKPQELLALARVLNLSIEYLVDDQQGQPPSPELTERERQIRDVIRTIGIEEAWQRLVMKPSNELTSKPFLGGITPVPREPQSGQDASGKDESITAKD